jgi:CubicO group peptidase (beta-lactamase class C family)
MKPSDTTPVRPARSDKTVDLRSELSNFDPYRMACLTDVIQADINAARIPGAVMLIASDGEIAYECALGSRNPAIGTPMTTDSIFRIYSMTKPIVSVGVMMLVEDGKLLLSDPVSKYLPEFRDMKVGIETGGNDGNTMLTMVPAERQMTVQDLLRHTSGLTYGASDGSLVKAEYLKSGVENANFTSEELVRRLSGIPLAYQPGTMWEYGRSTDVLGALIERITGNALDVYLDERILKPLGMTDTGFWVPREQQHRIAEPFATDPDSGQPIKLIDVRSKPAFLSGGGGMVSTARDYFRFASMLASYGTLDQVRILSRKTVQYMTSDHLSAIPGATANPDYMPGPGYGFGLGFAIRTSRGAAITPGSIGDYHWSGVAGTYFWIDPAENLVAIWLMQAPEQRMHYRQLFRNLVYAAL